MACAPVTFVHPKNAKAQQDVAGVGDGGVNRRCRRRTLVCASAASLPRTRWRRRGEYDQDQGPAIKKIEPDWLGCWGGGYANRVIDISLFVSLLHQI